MTTKIIHSSLTIFTLIVIHCFGWEYYGAGPYPPVYPVYLSVTSSNAIRSTNAVVAQYDLTGICYYGPNCTLIAPSFTISASHFTPGVGATLKWYNRDGNAITRTIVQQWDATGGGYTSSDIRISRLNAPITDSDKVKIYYIPFCTNGQFDKKSSGMTTPIGRPIPTAGTFSVGDWIYSSNSLAMALVFSGNNLCVTREGRMNPVSTANSVDPLTGNNDYILATGGESSSPAFMVAPDGDLVFFGTFKYPGGYSYVPVMITNIVGIMAQYGEAPRFKNVYMLRTNLGYMVETTNSILLVDNHVSVWTNRPVITTNSVFTKAVITNNSQLELSDNSNLSISNFYIDSTSSVTSPVVNLFGGTNNGSITALKGLAISNTVSGSGTLRCGTLFYTNGKWSLNTQ